jgi:hypothetical protein
MTDLFKEIIPSILQSKKNVITEENERDYMPFIVNRALSFHRDCVIQANEMNKFPATDRIMQYHFLLNKVRGYKRPFQPWQKREKNEDLDAIKEYYSINNEKAIEALSILSHDQIDEIKYRIRKGGLQNDKHNRSNRGDITRT